VVRAGAALGLPVLARRAVEAGARGLEWAVGVPGSVGGAVRMNAGGHGSDVAASLRSYRWMDLASGGGGEDGIERLDAFYRATSVGPSEVVVSAEFAAARGPVEPGRAEIAEIVRWRRANQPGGSNAGSVFTNPPGQSAGALIDGAGLKGRREGSASVSTKHANFIQADHGGSADDVHRLIGVVRDLVEAGTGIRLETEVRLVGFDGDEQGVGG
jgi:UDP-N-acetylmuramate dehydrogenase